MSDDEQPEEQEQPDAVPKHMPPIRKPGNPRHPWASAELEYVQGAEIDGLLEYPRLEDLSKKYGIPFRSIADASSRKGWVSKREEYRKRFALDAHKGRIARLLKQMERFDGQAFAVANAGINEVLRIFNDVNMRRSAGEDVTMGETRLDKALQAAERAQKIGRLAMHLPTELTAAAKSLEDEQKSLESVATSESVALKQTLEQLNKLEGDTYIQGLNAIFGLPPGGQPPAVEPGREIPLAVRVLPENALGDGSVDGLANGSANPSGTVPTEDGP